MLKGGYAGIEASDPNSRNIECTKTILSGDLAGDDIALDDARDPYDEPTRQENSKTVMELADSAELDGVVICGGYFLTCRDCIPFRPMEQHGGGARILGNNVTVRNCQFMGNYAGELGGGTRPVEVGSRTR